MSDLNGIGRREYRLYDNSRHRFVPGVTSLLNESEIVSGNEYFARCFCPHLVWREPVESGAIIEQGTETTPTVRSYKIQR